MSQQREVITISDDDDATPQQEQRATTLIRPPLLPPVLPPLSLAIPPTTTVTFDFNVAPRSPVESPRGRSPTPETPDIEPLNASHPDSPTDVSSQEPQAGDDGTDDIHHRVQEQHLEFMSALNRIMNKLTVVEEANAAIQKDNEFLLSENVALKEQVASLTTDLEEVSDIVQELTDWKEFIENSSDAEADEDPSYDEEDESEEADDEDDMDDDDATSARKRRRSDSYPPRKRVRYSDDAAVPRNTLSNYFRKK